MTNASKTMENGRLKKGDKVVVNPPVHQGPYFREFGTIEDIITASDGQVLFMVRTNIFPQTLTPKYGHEIRRETFLDFITRPTGFGKTSWPQFALIVAFSMVLLVLAVTMTPDGSWAKGICYLFGFGIPAVLLVMTWRNFKGKTV